MDSALVLPSEVSVSVDGLTVTLVPAADGQTPMIEVSKDLTPDEIEWPQRDRRDPATGLPVLEFGGGPFIQELFDFLQYCESLGAFWLGIRKVHWEEATFSWVPETDEETARLLSLSMSFSYGFRGQDEVKYDPLVLEQMISCYTRDRDLTVPMAFLREGIRHHDELQFINAFFNFYFFLEGLFGRGKTKNSHVEAEFLASPQLCKAAAEALRNLGAKSTHPKHLDALRAWLDRRRLPESAEGLLRLWFGCVAIFITTRREPQLRRGTL
jgi:hypothetical protein